MTGVMTVGGTVVVVAVAAKGARPAAVGAAAPKRTLPAMASKRATACGTEFMVRWNKTGKQTKICKNADFDNIEQ